MVVNHKDKNKKNNKPENLEWVTVMNNVWHRNDPGHYLKSSIIIDLCKTMSSEQLEKFLAIGQQISEGTLTL
jgi:hypothetical protein